MFRSAPYGTALLDLEGGVVDANNALERMLGYTAEELAALPLEAYTDPDDAAHARALYRELVDNRRPPYELDHSYVAKDGSVVWAHAAVTLVRDPGQRPTFGIAMLEDVTGRRELEEQLRQSQKMEAVGRLAGGIAHDFNNLLTAIGGYTELALRRTSPAAEEIRADLGEIKRASDRAAGLTRQLLAFSRKQILQPEVLKLSDLVAEMDTMLNRLIGETIEIVTITYGPGGSYVEADPGQLEQVIVNLVVNARDAMPDGGRITIETATVDLSIAEARAKESFEAGPYVVLTVRDNGDGIEPAALARIFEPFFTTKEAGKGTGLGLATVYGIVKQSGGFVEVESAPGEGAAFRIYLPRHHGLSAAVSPAALAEPVAAAQHGETILLVEDEAVVRRLAREILEQTGYVVLEAPDALEALAIAQSHPEQIDLLVTDVVMPKLNGRELAERLTRVVGDLRVLYTSGYTDSEIVQDGTLLPGTAFLQKPFTVAQLVEKVRQLLETEPVTGFVKIK
jgi:PAS domain S-box-containing protein